MRAFFILLLSLMASFGATTYTEFYVQTTGANTNSGHTTDNGPTYTSVNGNWDGTSVFTPTDGSTPANTVTNGAWASIYNDGVNPTVSIAMVTNVAAGVNGAITINRATVSGTVPTSSATARTINIGGAWKGPNGSVFFPFGFLTTNSVITNTLAAGSVLFPRCNFKGGTTYSISSAASHALNGPIRFQGYTTIPGDQGKATIDGGGANITIMTCSGYDVDFVDWIISNVSVAAGNADGLTITGNRCNVIRVVVHDIREHGISLNGSGGSAIECEAYSCGLNANNASFPFRITGSGYTLLNCISHGNTAGTAIVGFSITAISTLVNCIADSNSGSGFSIGAGGFAFLLGCESFNNQGSGLDVSLATIGSYIFQNCNFVSNKVYGINSSGSTIRHGGIVNCGFGSGTMTNSSGSIATTVGTINESGSVLYPANSTPWVAPSTGNFSISLAQAKAAGRSAFTEVKAGYSGTIGYPDIGSAQSASTNSSGGSWTFSQ